MNADPPDFLKPGAHLDTYRIVRWKGGGSYGDVYEGEKHGKPYALKLSKHRHTSDDPGKTYKRQLRELVCLVQLEHPNIAKVLGWTRTEAGYGCLVLEYVDGWTVAEWLQDKRPTVQQVLCVFAKLAHALAYMHRMGVRHRDVSLSNAMVRKADGEPVIIDLGAGEYSGAHELTDAPLPPGTHRYRSPEAARFLKEHQNDPSARYDFPPEDDFYSLAVCLYDALTDAEPARRADARKAHRLNVNSPTLAPLPARKVNPRVPEPVSAWVERWLVRDLEKRRPALAAMPGALEELGRQGGAEWLDTVHPPSEEAGTPPECTTPPGTRRRVRVWAVAAAVLAAVAVFAWLRLAPSPEAPPSRPAPESSSGSRAAAPEPPPSPPPPSGGAVPSPSQVPPVAKESPSVSAPKNPPPSPTAAKKKKAAPVFSPEFFKQCALAGAGAAALMGCPASQVTPTRESCLAAAVRAMDDRGLERVSSFRIIVDPNQPDFAVGKCREVGRWRTDVPACVATVGDGRIESVVQEGFEGMPKGTRLYGQLWTSGDEVVGRYTRAVYPPGYDVGATEWERDFPVCLALGLNGGAVKRTGSKPGAAIIRASEPVRPIWGQWP